MVFCLFALLQAHQNPRFIPLYFSPLPGSPLFRVQLFLLLNDLAGRWPLLDALMRGVYVATIPVLAIVLLGLLTLAPRGFWAPAREKIALATVLALLGAAGVMWGVEALAQGLNLGTISPRPFMTRWVNLLIVEPQDNSFPCAEIMVAAILSVGIGFANRNWGLAAALAVLMLGVARLFCGSNYGADVAVGALLGAGLMLCALALCRAPKEKRPRLGNAALGAGTLALTALGAFVVGAGSPRFEHQLQLPWGRAATAASPAEFVRGAPVAARAGVAGGRGRGRAARRNRRGLAVRGRGRGVGALQTLDAVFARSRGETAPRFGAARAPRFAWLTWKSRRSTGKTDRIAPPRCASRSSRTRATRGVWSPVARRRWSRPLSPPMPGSTTWM